MIIGSVWSLAFDSERRILFSGGFDSTIVVWDIGSQKGTSYELNGHRFVCTYIQDSFLLFDTIIPVSHSDQ